MPRVKHIIVKDISYFIEFAEVTRIYKISSVAVSINNKGVFKFTSLMKIGFGSLNSETTINVPIFYEETPLNY